MIRVTHIDDRYPNTCCLPRCVSRTLNLQSSRNSPGILIREVGISSGDFTCCTTMAPRVHSFEIPKREAGAVINLAGNRIL